MRDALDLPDAPTTMEGLAHRLGVPADAALARIIDHDLKKEAFRFAQKGGQRRVEPSEPVYATSALEAPRALAHVLGFLLDRVRGRSSAFSGPDLAGQLVGGTSGARGRWLKTALARSLDASRLPSGFGAVRRNATWVVFRLSDLVAGGPASRPPSAPRVETKAPSRAVAPVSTAVEGPEPSPANAVSTETSPTETFERAFDAAFSRLDEAGRNLNFVKLHALRSALPDYDRERFDAGLRALRAQGKYALDPAEGTHDRATDDERAAGIVEAGTRFVYCRKIR